MTTTIEYIAKRDFKYGDKEVKRGDVIEPAGGKWDHKIFTEASGFVTVQSKTSKPRRRQSGGKKNAS